jgi:hypothetical protein
MLLFLYYPPSYTSIELTACFAHDPDPVNAAITHLASVRDVMMLRAGEMNYGYPATPYGNAASPQAHYGAPQHYGANHPHYGVHGPPPSYGMGNTVSPRTMEGLYGTTNRSDNVTSTPTLYLPHNHPYTLHGGVPQGGYNNGGSSSIDRESFSGSEGPGGSGEREAHGSNKAKEASFSRELPSSSSPPGVLKKEGSFNRDGPVSPAPGPGLLKKEGSFGRDGSLKRENSGSYEDNTPIVTFRRSNSKEKVVEETTTEGFIKPKLKKGDSEIQFFSQTVTYMETTTTEDGERRVKSDEDIYVTEVKKGKGSISPSFSSVKERMKNIFFRRNSY